MSSRGQFSQASLTLDIRNVQPIERRAANYGGDAMRVLIAEDDYRLAGFINRGLAAEGYAVSVAKDGRDAFNLAIHESFDLMVLDILMPFLDGFEVLRELRKRKHELPVLVLSARAAVEDRIRALDSGADDYMTKPFSIDELSARLRAISRRSANSELDTMRVADLEIDPATRCVMRGNTRLRLTPREYSLLAYLVRNKNHVVTRAMIAEHVWGQHFDSFTNVIDVYVRYVRAKIDSKFSAKLIHTVRGVGYLLSEHPP